EAGVPSRGSKAWMHPLSTCRIYAIVLLLSTQQAGPGATFAPAAGRRHARPARSRILARLRQAAGILWLALTAVLAGIAAGAAPLMLDLPEPLLPPGRPAPGAAPRPS